MASSLKELIESGVEGSVMIENVRVTRMFSGVLNVLNDQGDLTRAEIDLVRAELTGTGYRETESWFATQGASWLCDGLFAGVSLQIEKVT